MNFAIHYLTEYVYDAPVTDNLNALRVCPAQTSWQRCDDFHVRLDPEARTHRHVDYFGTEVLEFGVARPHDHLTIDVRARVATWPREPPPDPPWESIAHDGYREAAGEFLMPVGPQPPEVTLTGLRSQARAGSPMATVLWICELIPDLFEYRPGATYVGSTVADLLAKGAGVCQDFVHLALLLLRGEGIAARYVSGYLWSAPPQGGTDSVEVQTHAWVEALLPETSGSGSPQWIAVDPTNRGLAGEGHVKIGHGRHYADVPPVKGVYRGSSGSRLSASVTMSLLDPAATARA